MLTLGIITFQTAAALWALLLLPVVWWLLRLTPPRPERVSFPPMRFLLGLIAKEETPHKTPWWLTLLRILLVACLIFAIARPVIDRNAAGAAGRGTMLIVLDDGWAAAKTWQTKLRVLANEVDRARQNNQPVILVTTSPSDVPPALEAKAAAEIVDKVSSLQPRALAADRMALAERLREGLGTQDPLDIIWLADGLDDGRASAFAEALTQLGGGSSVRVLLPSSTETGMALGSPALDVNGLSVTATRAGSGAPQTVVVRALAANGRSLAEAPLTFRNEETRATGVIQLPLQLRNEVTRVEIQGERSAGAVYLLDDRWRRKTVGLSASGSIESNQPLLAPLYYVSRALEPFAELTTVDGDGRDLTTSLQAGLSMLVLADIGRLPDAERETVQGWVDRGGILVRFAGPRLGAGHDDLVPVELREGDRALGGALTWEEPQPIAPFEEQSPFAGLTISPEVTVSKQVLAQPTADLGSKVWARLADGTPLVTSERRGDGMIVLFHVTANTDWSNLPLSGVFVEMLRRILDMAQGTVATGQDQARQTSGLDNAAFAPTRALGGFGEFIDPPVDARPITQAAFDQTRPSPRHPAGLYGRNGLTRALNLFENAPELRLIGGLPSGVTTLPYRPAESIAFTGPLLLAAMILFLLDALAVLILSGSMAQLRGRFARSAPLLIIGLTVLISPVPGHAQTSSAAPAANDAADMEASLDTRLAYVRTGDSEIDSISEAGLKGLTEVLLQRTAIEPAAPVGVDVESDDIVFYPMLYWPVTADAPSLSPKAAGKVDAYLKNGGTILFDTRDHQSDLQDLTGSASPATEALRRVLSSVNVPPLEVVPPEHVLTKAFYLLQSFPGRWSGGPLWVEASGSGTPEGSANYDGVSSVIIGSNDYASAWAVDAGGGPMFPTVPNDPRQREFAYRTGVNIVMYVLTGNYKADQVHVPALLERLGQ
ncbi:hypothetical protein FHS85_003387 [Rhodoligotrophos appendicifer]|uniref:DUF4159 domain-containing protein n=1 Tax=Rhodoligotrophos appendicifer TaxID=987056 RepID=UPI0011859AA3|nr:DUF4159 domain-containing protein [Rhodoligotrophos appendicifer]